MSDLRVASLFAAIGFEVDKADLKKAEKQIDRFAKKTEGRLEKTSQRMKRSLRPSAGLSHRERRAEMQREAMLWRSEQVKRQRIHERMAIQSQGRISKALTAKRAVGFGGGLGMLGAAGAAFGGAAMFGDAMNFDKQLTSLDIASRGALGPMDKVRSKMINVSNETGVAKEEILAGSAAFVRLTGDGESAARAMETFARVSKATGSNIEDVAGTAAALTQQLGIQAPDFEKAFSIVVAGGKAGAIELKEMSRFSAELAAQFKEFSGAQGTRGLAELTATFQIAAQNFGGKAAETKTGLRALFGAFTQPATIKKLEKAKIRVFDIDPVTKQKTLRSFRDLMNDIADSKLALDPGALSDAFGSKEALAAFNAWMKNRAAWAGMVENIERAKDVTEDFAKVSESNAAKVEVAWNKVKNAAAEAAGFSLGKFVDLGEGLGTAAGVVADLFNDPKADAQGSPVARNKFLQQDAALQKFVGRGVSREKLAGMSVKDARFEAIRLGLPDEFGIGAREAAKREVAQFEERRRGFNARRDAGLVPGIEPGFRADRFGVPGQFGVGAPGDFVSVDQPFRYTGTGARGSSAPSSVTSNVTVNIDRAGAGPEEIEAAVQRAGERAARDIAAAAGQ